MNSYITNFSFFLGYHLFRKIFLLFALLLHAGLFYPKHLLAETIQEKDISHKLSISSHTGIASSMALVVEKKHNINGARAIFSIDGDFLTLEFKKKTTKKSTAKGSDFDKYILNFPTPDFLSKNKSTYRIQVSYGDSKIYLSKKYTINANCQKSGFDKAIKKVKKDSLKYNILKNIHKIESSALFLKQLNSRLTKIESKI